MSAAVHESRAASAPHSEGASRPSTSSSSSSLAFYGRSGGLATSPSLTYSRLGYVSPVYADKHATSHGIIGMSGYLSAPHLTLAPTIPNNIREGPMAAAGAAARKGQTRPQPRGYSSSARNFRRLSQKDLQYLQENEERNRQVFQQWLKVKAEEKLREEGTEEDKEKQRKEELERFLQREEELKKQSHVAVHEWHARKAAQAEIEAIQRSSILYRARQQTSCTKVRATTAQAINREREGRFVLRTGAHMLAPTFGRMSTLDSPDSQDSSGIFHG